ncbi:bem46 protein, variant [Malassezia cuniculi]|uniref:Bem46 protein, variant n=1 Tax=Malassezia cuniculi TaxID=948313 RepID=A0AAF0J6F6_9BASI|nr:bem46 protein, variant [Malassezia cuniculi]
MTLVGLMLRLVAGTVAVGAVAIGSLLYTQQRSLIYCATIPEDSRTVVETPDLYGMPFDDVTVETPDGEKLRSYVMRQSSAAAERPTIVMFHANAGNMGHRLPIAAVFYKRLGCNVVMLSYRGYGLSTGSPSEGGLRIDSQAMLDWVRGDSVLGKTKIFLYGQSIGGAVTIDLAARRSSHIAGMIVENTYVHADSFLSLPLLVPHLLPGLAPLMFMLRDVWPSQDQIKKIPASMPALFLSGDSDELVPPAHMKELYKICGSEAKEWHSFPGATHSACV